MGHLWRELAARSHLRARRAAADDDFINPQKDPKHDQGLRLFHA